ncbi:dTDP-4-dehydrorhamnose reductase family protein [Endozoicomonas acroporae]|uniref:dTDP-4-dehydrorhamnose reductase family protein n=1 Tax=Endozoicomonas acroporae TaxID=1701104 RepID=UPI0013D59432|nr:SDR family oxidoreductase [Endozoicomonas acroporae]
MSKKLLILGANGMLGGSLHRYFTKYTNAEVLGTVRSEHVRTQLAKMGFNNIVSGVDVLDEQILTRVLSEESPDYVFNCIGLIKQLSESKLPIPAIEINSLLPHKLAQLCSLSGSKFVHFSTDCVFSGELGGYTEQDVPDAVDIYGRSKLLGEVGYDGHLTLRTSIIGHELNSSNSLVDWFLRQQISVKGFSRACFSGMPTCFIAEFVEKYIFTNPDFSGVYHLSVNPIDKYSLLLLVKDKYGLSTDVQECSELIIDRSLNSDALRSVLGFVPPSWPELIEKMHSEYIEYFCRYE